MFRKTILSTVAAAVLATSAVSVSTSTASAGNRNKAIAGAVFGAAAVILGAELYRNHRKSYRSNGYDDQYVGEYSDHQPVRECFDKPIRRWNAYEGRKVIVGYRTVCN